jgi:hypothetical protein
MRSIPPSSFIKYRHALLVAALVAWLAGWVALSYFKGCLVFPIRTVVGVVALVFVWSTTLWAWLTFRYPYIEIEKGQFASRDEWKAENHIVGLVIAFVFAIFATFACANLILST